MWMAILEGTINRITSEEIGTCSLLCAAIAKYLRLGNYKEQNFIPYGPES